MTLQNNPGILDRIASYITRAPMINILVLAVLTIFFGYHAAHLRFDTSLSTFVIKNDPDMVYYEKVKEIFQTDETVIVGFKAESLFSKKDISAIETLSEKLLAVDGIRNVRSITTANLISSDEDVFEVKGLAPRPPETPAESDDIRKHVTTNYIYQKDLASEDGRFGSLIIDISSGLNPGSIKKIVGKIRYILKEESKASGLDMYLAGDAIINHSLGEYMHRDFFVFIIPIYILMFIISKITLGRIRDVAALILTVSISLIWSLGMISLLGRTFNNVTIGLVPLVFCLSLEDIYYVHNIYYNRLAVTKNNKLAFQEALRLILKPCLFTSLTTVVGFASLTVNNIKPIIDFGLLGAITACIAFFIAMVFIPSFHLLLKQAPGVISIPTRSLNADPLLRRVIAFIRTRGNIFFIVLPVLITVCIMGIMRIRIETDNLEFFHKNSEVYKSTIFIENNLAGISNLEITVDTGTRDGVKGPKVLLEIEELTQYIRSLPNVDKALSIVDFLKDMNRAMNFGNETYYSIPISREAVAQYLLLYSMSSRRNDVEKDFVNNDYSLARIRCRISEHNSTRILKLLGEIKAYVKKNIDPGLTVRITSYPVIYSNMVDSMAHGQIKNLIFVYAALFLLTVIYFRSFTIGALAIVPNVIPILFTFGFMGFTGISLNMGTTMISGIAIGLAMDDTTHFFDRFQIEQPLHPDYSDNMGHTYLLLGNTMIFSSLIMISTYLVLALSQFRLTVLFGLLCALTTFVALLCDMFITPWILITFKPKFK